MRYELSRSVYLCTPDEPGDNSAVVLHVVSFDDDTLVVESRPRDVAGLTPTGEPGRWYSDLDVNGIATAVEATSLAGAPARTRDELRGAVTAALQNLYSREHNEAYISMNGATFLARGHISDNRDADRFEISHDIHPFMGSHKKSTAARVVNTRLHLPLCELVGKGTTLTTGRHDTARRPRRMGQVRLECSAAQIERVESLMESITLISEGSMGMYLVSVGTHATKPRFCTGKPHTSDAVRSVYRVNPTKLRSTATLKRAGIELSDSQLDAVAMATLDETFDPRLHDDQLRAMRTHLSTKLGFVNALATGDGKTISTLTALNHRYYRHDDNTRPYRALVVVEAGVRNQWVNEAAQWLDDAIDVVAVNSRRDTEQLRAALDGDRPTLVVCSYTLCADADEAATDLGATLAEAAFDDVILDEGRTVRGRNKTARALWKIRRNSEIGVVLCATPVLKSVRDLALLMSWARNDTAIASPVVEATFAKMTSASEFDDWYAWWGPALVRSTTTRAKKLGLRAPKLHTSVVPVFPTDREIELSHAITGRIRDTLESVLATYRSAGGELDADAERKLRGSLLATGSLARQASSDPRMLTESTADIVELLRADGAISFPDGFVPAKVAYCVDDCATKVADGSQVVVFTEFKYSAKSIAAALEARGIPTALFLGQDIARRDAQLREFKDGQRSVLVATSAAERGLNLQVAKYLIHFDHKFTPDSIFQRTGRITRINSQHRDVHVSFYVTTGTIDERVFAVSVARAGLAGATATQTVEDFAESDRGRMLSVLVKHASQAALTRKTENSLLELTKELVK